MRCPKLSILTMTVVLPLSAGAVSAQQPGFVLFGDKDRVIADVPAEHRFVHPITSPYYHEDAFVTSDVRAWYVRHNFPTSSPIDGGHATVAAIQLRVALTERLGLVAYKDGYTWINSGLVDENGVNDLAAALKYAIIQDWENQFHLAVGAGYEFGIGRQRVLQGDSEIRLFAAVNKGFGALHLGGTVNYLIATGSEDALGDADRLFWHAHLDYRLNDWISPVIEFNGYHVVSEGREVLPFQGVDVANLGAGNDVITLGLGAEFRIPSLEKLALRGGYETPLTSRRQELWGWRLTFSAIWSF